MNHPLEAHHVTVLMNPNETELRPKRLRTKVCYFIYKYYKNTKPQTCCFNHTKSQPRFLRLFVYQVFEREKKNFLNFTWRALTATISTFCAQRDQQKPQETQPHPGHGRLRAVQSKAKTTSWLLSPRRCPKMSSGSPTDLLPR